MKTTELSALNKLDLQPGVRWQRRHGKSTAIVHHVGDAGVLHEVCYADGSRSVDTTPLGSFLELWAPSDEAPSKTALLPFGKWRSKSGNRIIATIFELRAGEVVYNHHDGQGDVRFTESLESFLAGFAPLTGSPIRESTPETGSELPVIEQRWRHKNDPTIECRIENTWGDVDSFNVAFVRDGYTDPVRLTLPAFLRFWELVPERCAEDEALTEEEIKRATGCRLCKVCEYRDNSVRQKPCVWCYPKETKPSFVLAKLYDRPQKPAPAQEPTAADPAPITPAISAMEQWSKCQDWRNRVRELEETIVGQAGVTGEVAKAHATMLERLTEAQDVASKGAERIRVLETELAEQKRQFEILDTELATANKAAFKCCPRNAWGDGEHDGDCPRKTLIDANKMIQGLMLLSTFSGKNKKGFHAGIEAAIQLVEAQTK